MAATGRPSSDCRVLDAGHAIAGPAEGSVVVFPHADAAAAAIASDSSSRLFKVDAHLASEPPRVARRRIGFRRPEPPRRLDRDGNGSRAARHTERHTNTGIWADVLRFCLVG